MPRRAFAAAPRSSAPSRSRVSVAVGLAFLAALAASWHLAQVHPGALLQADARRNIARFVAGMFPPELSPDFLRLLVTPVLETLQISVAGTALAVALGVPLGLLATASLSHAGVLHEQEARGARRLGRMLPYLAARALLSVFRSIPEFVWAFMFVRAVGLGPPAGVLAIGVSYGGMLGKVYSEILENLELRPSEALHAAGASRAEILLYAMIPQSLPQLLSYTLYRWECAVRASAILGFVGAGGLGQQIELSMRMFNFHEVVTLVIVLFLLVAVVDVISDRIRRAIR